MDLYIVRHGEALPAASDAARQLSDHGRAEVEAVANAIHKRRQVENFLWSPQR